ncbi:MULTISPECIES: hypothetical protein [Streptomyces]|nr:MULTISPECIES: hypothetical protein [Streptomyces]
MRLRGAGNTRRGVRERDADNAPDTRSDNADSTNADADADAREQQGN